MHVPVLIPVKRLDAAKSRLASGFSPAQRVELMHALVADTAAAARAGSADVRLVTSDPAAAALAGELGMAVVSDGGLGWNDGLVHALASAALDGPVAFLAADLPLLEGADVERLLAALAPGAAVIARAHDGGTNALGLWPARAMRPAFGAAASAAVHERLAGVAGLRTRLIDVPGLALDLDTPQDAERVLAARGGGRARELLERYRNRSRAGSRTRSAAVPSPSAP